MRTFDLCDIETGEKIVTLEWGTWAIHRFCELIGIKEADGTIKPENISAYLAKFKPDEVTGKTSFTFADIIKMIMAAADSFDDNFNASEKEVTRWYDRAGGLANEDTNVVKFIRFTLGEVKTDTTEQKKTEAAEG